MEDEYHVAALNVHRILSRAVKGDRRPGERERAVRQRGIGGAPISAARYGQADGVPNGQA